MMVILMYYVGLSSLILVKLVFLWTQYEVKHLLGKTVTITGLFTMNQ